MLPLHYPLGREIDTIPRRGIMARLGTWYATHRAIWEESRIQRRVDLSCLSGYMPIYQDDMPLVVVTRNNRSLLPAFFSHYRGLGVTRFICVDDKSDDGSREFLLQQRDVDLWISSVRFRDARRGRLWREKLFNIYGKNRWYLNVDSDEFLVFDEYEKSTIWSLIDELEEAGHLRMPAPMLDLYPMELDDANSANLSNLKPWDVADHFDTEGYALKITKRGISILGGPRHREFQQNLELVKYPLIYWDSKCSLGSSIHLPLPYDRNFAPIKGALLHFKFFSDYRKTISQAAKDGQHFDNARAYRKMLDQLGDKGSLNFNSDVTTKYSGVGQLVELGFMCQRGDRHQDFPAS